MPFRRIIAGVNGSDASVRAASMAALIAQRAGARCTPVSALPDYGRLLSSEGFVADVAGIVTAAELRGREQVCASLGGRVPGPVRDALVMEPGQPATVLRWVAERLAADLIVIGAHRHHTPLLRGARIARQLVRTGSIPVLVTNGGAPAIGRILVGLDLSYASQHTWQTAREWARLFGAELRVLHVREPLLPMVGPTVPFIAAGTPYGGALSQSDLWTGIAESQKVVRSGHPAEAIAEEAAAWGADLVIVGSHGHGWTRHLLIGRTADALLHHPPAMTLVVPSGIPASQSLEPAALGAAHHEPAPAVAL